MGDVVDVVDGGIRWLGTIATSDNSECYSLLLARSSRDT